MFKILICLVLLCGMFGCVPIGTYPFGESRETVIIDEDGNETLVVTGETPNEISVLVPYVSVGTPWVYYQNDWYYNGVLYSYYGTWGWWPYGRWNSACIVQNRHFYGTRWHNWYRNNPHHWRDFHNRHPHVSKGNVKSRQLQTQRPGRHSINKGGGISNRSHSITRGGGGTRSPGMSRGGNVNRPSIRSGGGGKSKPASKPKQGKKH